MNPARRRRYAVWLLIVSLVLGHANLIAAQLGTIGPDLNDRITNYLSWLAITLTALDLLATSDVRVEQDDEPTD